MMNAQGIERAEIMGDWYEEMSVEEHCQEWKARQRWIDAGCPPLDGETEECLSGSPEPEEWTDEELEDFSRRCRE